LWTIWLTAVSINVVVWALVSGTTAHLVYPWPLWVAGPYGAALFAVSAGVMQVRQSRRSAERRLPRVSG
jgi:NhaP-type Na+/H+ or K+/H+ antiporter